MLRNVENLTGFAFIAYEESLPLLLSELKSRFPQYKKPEIFGDLVCFFDKSYSEDFLEAAKNQLPYWARTCCFDVKKVSFDSIGDAAKFLKDIQRNWAGYQFANFRRGTFIQEKLPYINFKPKNFPFEIVSSNIGLYTLLDEHTMLVSANTTSTLPLGQITFVEDHENPPSRAYLKIQEALVRFKAAFPNASLPQENDYCFEAGACPGGWTWVLRNLGCRVMAVDRAPLVEKLMNDPMVEFVKHDAFTLKPEEIGKVDWVFSDVICYPERLYEWVNKWLDSGLVSNMICTIKMQGEIDWELVSKFANIPNSKVVHLCYNKHELTWMHCKEGNKKNESN